MPLSPQDAANALGLETNAAAAHDVRIGRPTRDRVERFVQSANALVQQYAPNAPDEIQEQAALQIVGYLAEAPENTRATQNAMLSSGAASMLAPWRVHRAGAIG